MPQHIARWNPARGAWKTDQQAVCEHSVLYSATWPTSGMTRRGVAYELPTSAPRTDGSGSSSPPGLLPTPDASLGSGGSQPPEKRRAGGHMVQLIDVAEHLLPTLTATPYGRNRSESAGAAVRPSLDSLAPTLLPTPEASDATGGRVSSEVGGTRPSGSKRAITLATALSHGVHTSPPSDAGNESSGDPRQLPLSQDETADPG